MNLLLPILLLLPALTQSFSLDIQTKGWNYTTSNLAATTSAKCKSAYAADINCDGFLVSLVNAHERCVYLRTMEPGDFTDMCTSTCESLLSEYIENVRDACSESGDVAVKAKGYLWFNGTEHVPVETVGLIFQYMLVRACARDEHGENCYNKQNTYFYPDFACGWDCALAYYWTAHFYPYSDWNFGNPELKGFSKENDVVLYSNYMMQGETSAAGIQKGWEKVRKCGRECTKKSPPFDRGISEGHGGEKSEKSSGNSAASFSSALGTATGVASSSAAAATPAETGSAERNGLVMGYLLAVTVPLSGYIRAFTCSGLSGYASRGTCILFWTTYITITLLLNIIDPLSVLEFKRKNEDERVVILRRPLVGFKAYEVFIDLEAIAKREYTIEGGGDDNRLYDGYRYGLAFIRI
ncbi:uncharacterized protein KD926_004848 [Aspergillus affinis]|uniref:uncharacterized protein n=1 Tax=Aspergillus affinis TaxID=1070780 RepID=UPI0022FEDDFA|nr:uncharacterized protein KD926_004848 [Aspergillus affinis]KAI9034993.1 hypothetical protein KD926_004848 [Aspergillus affinis]